MKEKQEMNQITFDDYIKRKSMEYASTCRHYERDYCHISGGEPKQCPCEYYEIQKSCFENNNPCTGQTKKYKGLSKCFSEGTVCYRYCFNKGVLTIDNPDKYKPSK